MVATTSNAMQSATHAIWHSHRAFPYDAARLDVGERWSAAEMNGTSSGPFTGSAIALDRVNLSLGGGTARVHILRDINLNIGRGEAVGLLGPSGSGKSTLLMVMTGLERPDTGSVMVGGQDFTRLGEDELARFRGKTIGIVFQAFHLIPTMTALENVAVPLELAGASDPFARAERELVATGLGGRLNHYPAEMSGGEQQRVALARALAPDPAILVADEPTGNLDETTGGEIIELLFRGHRERGTTLVLVTHDSALAARCDRVVHMHSGRIKQSLPQTEQHP
jgi:putative ABC transport system ATP-binding protein